MSRPRYRRRPSVSSALEVDGVDARREADDRSSLRSRCRTAAGLAAEQAGVDHPLQQRRGGVQRLLELLVQRLGDRLGGVQADQVGQRERALRVGGAEHQAAVDVLGGGEAGLEHPDRGEDERDQQRVDHEAGAGPGSRSACLPSEPSTHAPRSASVVSSEVSSDGTSSTSWSTGTGLKKCDADHLLAGAW